MNLEQAIETAIEYETRVQGVYEGAAEQARDDVGRKVFAALAEEEAGHVLYLEHRLDEVRRSGAATPEPLGTVVPSPEAIAAGIAQLERQVAPHERGFELDLLRQALEAEIATSEFYERMVAELGSEGEALFGRFLEIEQGHQAIVQAEIDAVSGMGFWFDFQEFNLEAG
ncbi:MAG: ferritin family protein [bacterium]